MLKYSGECLCGAVRFEGEADPVFMGNCYCVDCRKASGGGHSTSIGVPVDRVKVTGELATFAKKGDSGAIVSRHFCPKCGVRLFATSTGAPGLMMLTAGVLDDPEVFKPLLSVYASRAPSWDPPPAGAPSFPEMPPKI